MVRLIQGRFLLARRPGSRWCQAHRGLADTAGGTDSRVSNLLSTASRSYGLMAPGRFLARLCLWHILPYWRTGVVLITPLALLPVSLIGTQEALTAYVILIMAVYWMTEALPLPITSLIPIVAFPLLGILNTNQVCMNYFSETVVMFIGGLMVGLAVEYCNLHKRIALRVLLSVGTDPKWLMMGFMAVTGFLSMFVSNTGACAMICPIVEAMVAELYQDSTAAENHLNDDGSKKALTYEQMELQRDYPVDDSEANSKAARQRRLRVVLLLSVAYSANIGGTGTLIGSTPQLALKGIVDEMYGDESDLSFASWMAVLMPAVLISFVLTWFWLWFLMSGCSCSSHRDDSGSTEGQIRAKNLVQAKYRELGPLNFNEKTILILFPVLVLFWMFRDPRFMPGWSSFFTKKIGDSVPVLIVVIILFILPAKPDFWCLRKAPLEGRPKPSVAMLTWEFLNDKLPWGLVLLLGSGFALSDASKVSGLSVWMGGQLSGLQFLPPFAMLVICCMITTWMTEIVSNTATANIVLPILAKMAETVGINPLYLMVPAAATCCYTFVLPVGTPANAIVYNRGKMKPGDMVKAGVITKLVTVTIVCVVMETVGKAVFPVHFEAAHQVNSTASIFDASSTIIPSH